MIDARPNGETMRIFWTSALRVVGLLFLVPACVNAQQTANAVAPLVGNWDLPGTMTRLKIHADGTVDHSKLGEGTIQYDEASYFRLVFRQQHLSCTYEVRKYSENELTFTVSIHPSDSDCELGALRRSPGSEAPPAPTKSNKSSESLPAGNTGDDKKGAQAGATFKDCDDCPELIIVPAGQFTMGSPDAEPGRLDIEGPQRPVQIKSNFAVGRYAITRDQFETFVKATGRLYDDGCYTESAGKWLLRPDLSFRAPGFPQDGRHPVVCVTWDDANAYTKWVSAKTGKTYRLLTEAEREYVTRAGTSSAYWWGGSVRPDLAHYDKVPQRPAVEQNGANKAKLASDASTVSKVSASPTDTSGPIKGTVPVHLFQPNPWGLFQVHGNVAEWVADCWNRSYMGAPLDSATVTTGDCERHVLRGGGWSYWASDIRSAYRESAHKENRYVHVGFRVARDLT
jgi:formylglycine-generating enzyme required for sulfatase activity